MAQILKYEVGQFYKTHHDQNSGLFTPQGARVYTFFMYLSTPEEGGGTRFTDLGLVRAPGMTVITCGVGGGSARPGIVSGRRWHSLVARRSSEQGGRGGGSSGPSCRGVL
eukprot:scaffold2267_cov112-Isochrysis_galbana.AAC.7